MLAAQAVGNQSRLALLLNLTPQAIAKWKRTRIPAEWVLKIEKLTKVSRHDLRPDLYPRR